MHSTCRAFSRAVSAGSEMPCGRRFCERRPFAVQKVAFERVKDGLSQLKRPSFAKPSATGLTARCGQRRVNHRFTWRPPQVVYGKKNMSNT